MITLIESTNRSGIMKPGEWRKTDRGVLVCCPGCKKIMSLTEHTIDPDGTVMPPLDCPFKHCQFREYARLADWRA